ncbi:MAG: amidohydrolase family protein [Balneolaceae bacterium]|nr:amidohydrolase family protein [Balneolaceae bacterium]
MIKSMINNLLLILLFAVFTACSDPEPQTISLENGSLTAFTGANVLPMTDEVVLENQTVIIQDGRISVIGDTGEVEIPDGAEVIDATGKYLMPGLAEMHGHVPGPNNRQYAKDVLFLYISNGVTTVRNMAGHPYHLELRDRVDNGELAGPMLFAASPWLSPNNISEPAEAEDVVRGYKEAGFDLMKIGSISLESYRAMAEVAHEIDLPFAGHIPEEVGLVNALEARQASIDHLDRYVEFLVADNPEAESVSPGFFGSGVIDYVDEERIDEAIRLTIEAGTWNVPTLSLVEHLESPESPEDMIRWPEMRYMPQSVLDGWVESKHNFQARDDFQPDAARKLVELRQKLTKELHDAGALIALGSDAPQFFNVPGFSIHHELRMMVDTGLTPYEVLVTGTRNAGIYFDMADEFGTLEEGRQADIIVLNANPFNDIEHVRNQYGVMVRGVWWSRDVITQRLEEIAARNSR